MRFNVLLLGTGDAGKSTFVRQLRLIHEDDIPIQERLKFTNILRDNCLVGMQKLINACLERQSNIEFDISDEWKTSATKIISAEELTPDIAILVSELWSSDPIRKILQHSKNLQIPGGITGITHFAMNARNFAEDTFVPSNVEVILAKLRTTGVSEVTFRTGNQEFNMIDVGGQRSERRKWLHCFQSVHAVIFMVALNEYDAILEEDGKTNRLAESLKLFQLLTGTKWLSDKPCLLFLNKSDLFQDEIEAMPLERYFEGYESFAQELVKSMGGDGKKLDKFYLGVEFMKKLFLERFQGAALYVYVTCAVNKDDCAKVFKVIRSEILENSLTLVGL